LSNAKAAARPAVIEEPLNAAIVHPLARALLPFAVRTGIHPNAISVAGIAFGMAAAAAFQRFEDWRYTLAGFLAMLGWHVLDGLDGMVARATGRTSDFGRFLDGVCDYSVFVLVYASLADAAAPALGAETAWAGAAMAGIAHAVQAAWYEAQREQFIRRTSGQPQPTCRRVAGGLVERAYNRMQRWLLTVTPRLDARLDDDRELKTAYFQRLAPVGRASTLLAPTGRTLAIAVACLAGSPMFYWLWEIVGLSPAMLLIDAVRRRREADLIG
jgi:phosphatidylglycerophosphate synthase